MPSEHLALAERLSKATALAWEGRGREADALLGEVDPASLSPEDLISWTLPRAANQFWMLSEPERATAFLANIRNRVLDEPSRLTIDALSAMFAMNSGALDRSMALADEVLSSPVATAQAVGWAASAASLCAARMGRVADVDSLAHRAVDADHPGLLRFTVGFARITAALHADRMADAQRIADELGDGGTEPGRAIGALLRARVRLHAGDAANAADLVAAPAAVLERTGYSWGPLALMTSAHALGAANDPVAAAKALARAEARHGLKSQLFAPELGMARAQVTSALGDRDAAIAAIRDAARTAERTGQRAVAVQAWRQAERLGDARAGAEIQRLR
ncbi:hypothetical protein LV457_00560 [Mycobacterium sp. MYCO198283]|uniref:hypothetical protein n=1 Tax=Mycobacterium sp. MYCO198283 TaxID=2883505 RepID=UPI001E3EE503|nr:hypothetical protein [Mycobacterium sp. MYCO198283]MCG5430790.1 hypothetical protein [Mycobacterium sp. MYCO198283]